MAMGRPPVRAEVICGDARDALGALDDASCAAVITDPPYALTSGKDGRRGFMGRRWDTGQVAHDPAFWAEVLRVAKPGAYLVAFGGTRTVHRMATAIEDAGWEIRDSVYWAYGSGFPKSLSVSKAIDKAAGAERERLGRKDELGVIHSRGNANSTMHPGWRRPHHDNPEAEAHYVSAPATDAARQWDGWGTALKPAVEPLVLARKPLAEGTVAANVLAHGTGALHIDACRVPTGDSLNGGAYAQQGTPRDDGWGMQRAGAGDYQQPAGRWPSNLVLSHVGGPDGCQPAGVRRVPADKRGQGRPRGTFPHSDDAWGNGHRAYTGAETAGDGTEAQQEYRCVEGCPVAELDRQAGPSVSRSGGLAGEMGYHAGGTGAARGGHDDAGGPSRFFPTFAPDPADAVPFRYCRKASRRERNQGLDGRPALPVDRYGECGQGATPQQTPRVTRVEGNHHPCVKPLNLMSWLVRLIAGPGAVVLDPFCGSGSTGVACVREGFGFIGIEAEPAYAAIARARIAHEQEQRAGPLFAGIGTAASAAR